MVTRLFSVGGSASGKVSFALHGGRDSNFPKSDSCSKTNCEVTGVDTNHRDFVSSKRLLLVDKTGSTIRSSSNRIVSTSIIQRKKSPLLTQTGSTLTTLTLSTCPCLQRYVVRRAPRGEVYVVKSFFSVFQI